jgi:hypothetical protein
MNEPIRLTDELLQAYVDRQLDAATAARIEAALRTDPVASAFVQREQALRQRLDSAFSPVLAEAVPQRLLAALKPPPAAKAAPAPTVIPLAAARQRKAAAAKAAAAAAARGGSANPPGWRFNAWPSALGMAASLLVGLVLGQRLLPAAPGAPLVASAELVQALDTQSAATQAADAPVHMATSFVSQAGRYCRSFRWPHEAVAGLACRGSSGWQVELLAQAPAQPGGALRQAASPMPPALLQAIDSEIAGPPLDAAAEQLAIQRGWTR